MAIAIPLLMSATGASAAIGAAVGLSSMAVSVISAVAFQVSGINDKVNRAAASVFGEDLVKIGNIFGAAYGAFGGGFGGAGMEAGAGNYVNSMDAASDAFATSGAANAGGVTGGMNLADMAGDAYSGAEGATDLANQADAIGQMGGDAADFRAATDGTQASAETQTASNLTDPREVVAQTQQPASLLPNTGAASQQAAGSAGAQAAAAPTASASGANAAAAAPGQRSFFDRLLYNDKGNVSDGAMRMGGQILSGVGQGYSAAQAAKQRQAQFDAEMRMRNQRPNVVVTR